MSNDLWRTPDWLFHWLNELYGPFDIDLAASAENAKCARFITVAENALTLDWRRLGASNGFCNPPYSDVVLGAILLIHKLLAMTTKVQTELETLGEIQLALKLGPVWCDVVNPDIKHVPVRNVRKFAIHKLGSVKDLSDNEWTSKFNQGKAKGYEVLIMEGWRVPERVYVVSPQ